MEKDLKFIDQVQNLFLEHGAKTLTMDDIARELSISKKTLYQRYKNKEALLEEVLANGVDKVLVRLRNLEGEIENAIDRMLLRDDEITRISISNNSILLKQLIKYYPRLFERHMRLFSEKFAEIIQRNIERGRKQGYYREDFDPYFYAKFFFQSIMSYDNSPYIESSQLSRSEYQQEVLMLYMHAITTQKGKDYLDSKTTK